MRHTAKSLMNMSQKTPSQPPPRSHQTSQTLKQTKIIQTWKIRSVQTSKNVQTKPTIPTIGCWPHWRDIQELYWTWVSHLTENIWQQVQTVGFRFFQTFINKSRLRTFGGCGNRIWHVLSELLDYTKCTEVVITVSMLFLLILLWKNFWIFETDKISRFSFMSMNGIVLKFGSIEHNKTRRRFMSWPPPSLLP